MRDFSDLLRADGIVAGIAPLTKKALFNQLGALAGEIDGHDPRLVAERLANRERLGSTGFGGGVAIPHARLPGLDAPFAIFARLAQPIAFDAVDDVAVDLVLALFSPERAGSEHLKALARVSRRLRDRAFLAKLRGAGSRDALVALLTTAETRDAA